MNGRTDLQCQRYQSRHFHSPRPGLRHNQRHADLSPNRPHRAAARPDCRALVRTHLSGRFRPVSFSGHQAPAPSAVCAAHGRPGLDAQGCRGHPVPGCGRCRDRRTPGLLPVLQAQLLPVASAGDICRVAGRHGLPWRAAGRDWRHAVVCALAPSPLVAGGRLCRALRAHGLGGRAHRQLHQWRAVGPFFQPGPALGHGVRAQRLDAAAPPLADLPVPA